MPPVPAVRGDQVVKALERAGFQLTRIRGSHHVMRHPDGRGTTVPVHRGRDVAKGTLRGILADCGMSVDELGELL
ncbi:type II toxin-antitoxin system HicA family toxin [Nocardiopsis sp. EMB25]|uniref:type II toxin-antitoxin system HicA family toxin n=1 Tax=Nocardiopsis sp. EMB25 TaxID=2835867 RepID=UPI0022836187|nr:type II toxin-antitoxin system HicA family toxin [Nocardiopsis sp. EMB25]MCY9785490.1 type II toxin-antitoxin system HicA family toxin [Nocardiopsis sp. EMB25]